MRRERDVGSPSAPARSICSAISVIAIGSASVTVTSRRSDLGMHPLSTPVGEAAYHGTPTPTVDEVDSVAVVLEQSDVGRFVERQLEHIRFEP